MLWLAGVLVVVDDVVLENVIGQLPVLEPTSHDEGLQFIEENVFELLLLEQKKQIVKQEVAVLDSHTKLNANPYEHSVPLFSLSGFRVIELSQQLACFLLVLVVYFNLFVVALVGGVLLDRLLSLVRVDIFQERVVRLLLWHIFDLFYAS